jgi:hypothetical protein
MIEGAVQDGVDDGVDDVVREKKVCRERRARSWRCGKLPGMTNHVRLGRQLIYLPLPFQAIPSKTQNTRLADMAVRARELETRLDSAGSIRVEPGLAISSRASSQNREISQTRTSSRAASLHFEFEPSRGQARLGSALLELESSKSHVSTDLAVRV